MNERTINYPLELFLKNYGWVLRSTLSAVNISPEHEKEFGKWIHSDPSRLLQFISNTGMKLIQTGKFTQAREQSALEFLKINNLWVFDQNVSDFRSPQ